MFEHIHADLMHVHRRPETPGPLTILCLLWRNPGLQAMVIYRFGRWLGKLRQAPAGWVVAAPLYPAYWLGAALVRTAYGVRLAQSADIAPGLYIGHLGGIEVRRCRIGPRCAIAQQVKLGSADDASSGPIIGEDVWIGAHTQIRVDVTVGDGVTIGAGTVVTRDIPDRCLVLGSPGRIAQRSYDNGAFL